MNKITLIVIFLFSLQLVSCQQTSKKNQTIKIDDKSVTNNFFKQFNKIYGDNGLLETGNSDLKKGGFEIYLISKIGAKNWYNNVIKKQTYDSTIKVINQLSPQKISLDFDIWVFYTDKNYLTELEDGSLGPKIPGIIELYYLKSGEKTWQKIESYSLKNDNDRIKSFTWKQTKLQDIIDQSNIKKNENKDFSSLQKVKLSNKWIGKYNAYYSYGKIGGENAGWNLEIEISNDSIIVIGDGYQIGFTDLLIAKENGNELLLNHFKNLNGYNLGSKMNPEFVLIENKEKYFIKTKWIDHDIVPKPDILGYEIFKN
ncbi:hypothetical protein [Flavobacterium sp. KJJ]|uniref:hypothetical protein n=1 Tax=Flavobacterium sp. KJJ TaxID=1270193 RepID=UPI000493A666|nr:hypothetical protein [Flavobacterium sp. KJJ]